MIKTIFSSLIIITFTIVFIAGCASNTLQTKSVIDYNKSDQDYLNLVNKIKTNQATAQDYDSIIKIYPLTSFYEPASDKEQAAKLISQTQMENAQWRDCLITNNALLANNYTSLTGHYGAAICSAELGNLALGRFHNAILDNFIEAIWRTGDGQTPQSPFYITSSNDLYAFIQLHQLVAVGQSLIYVNNYPIQAIKVQQPESKRTTTWYFDVTPTFRKGVLKNVESN